MGKSTKPKKHPKASRPTTRKAKRYNRRPKASRSTTHKAKRYNRRPKAGKLTAQQKDQIKDILIEFYKEYADEDDRLFADVWDDDEDKDEKDPWRQHAIKIMNKHIEDGTIIGLLEYLSKNEPHFQKIKLIHELNKHIHALEGSKRSVINRMNESLREGRMSSNERKKKENEIELIKDRHDQDIAQAIDERDALLGSDPRGYIVHLAEPVITKEFIDSLRVE